MIFYESLFIREVCFINSFWMFVSVMLFQVLLTPQYLLAWFPAAAQKHVNGDHFLQLFAEGCQYEIIFNLSDWAFIIFKIQKEVLFNFFLQIGESSFIML